MSSRHSKKTHIYEWCLANILNSKISYLEFSQPFAYDLNLNSMNSNLSHNNNVVVAVPSRVDHPMLDLMSQICSEAQQVKAQNTNEYLLLVTVRYFYPLILIFGLVGNFISFCAMVRIYRRRKNYLKFSLSLACLALTDLIVLLIGCMREYLDEIFDLSLRSSSIFACKSIMFSCYSFSCFSAYLHGYIAIERWVAINDPIKSKSRLTFHSNKLAITFILFICVCFNLPLLWFPHLSKKIQLDDSSSLGIGLVDECEVTHDRLLFFIDSVFNCFIPFLITVLFSILTLVKLIRSKSIFTKSDSINKRHFNPSKVTTNLTNLNATRSSTHSGKLSIRFKSNHANNINNNNFESPSSHISRHSKGGDKNNPDSVVCHPSSFRRSTHDTRLKLDIYRSRKSPSLSSNLKMTLMLMALPLSYLVTTFPIFTILMQNLFKNSFEQADSSDSYMIGKIFMYINNSINILFYILFGKSLRKDFWAILPLKNLIDKCILEKKSIDHDVTLLRKANINNNKSNNHLIKAKMIKNDDCCFECGRDHSMRIHLKQSTSDQNIHFNKKINNNNSDHAI
jgi:hypothetical protein